MGLDYGYLKQLFVSCLEAEYSDSEGMGSYAYLRDGDLLYIFFEKSNGAIDWMNNLSYHAVPRGRAGDEWFCHEGFLRVFEEIVPFIDGVIRSPSTRRVITVGYSHGAALALLCHEYIWYTRPDIIGDCESYGFGGPRVVFGTVPGEGERWRNFYVVRNIDDAVTHLPPRFVGYRHVGGLIEIGKAGKYGGFEAHKQESYLAELDFSALNA